MALKQETQQNVNFVVRNLLAGGEFSDLIFIVKYCSGDRAVGYSMDEMIQCFNLIEFCELLRIDHVQNKPLQL